MKMNLIGSCKSSKVLNKSMNVYVNKRLNSIKAIVIVQKMTSMWISFTISL